MALSPPNDPAERKDQLANVNGADSFAYVGEAAWHGKGTALPQGAPIEVWAKTAGLDYTIEQRPLYYRPTCDQGTTPRPARAVQGKVIQVRSDTGADLGIVSDRFKTTQPVEVLEFFRQWASEGGVTLETAGALYGGRQQFALARIGDAVNLALEGQVPDIVRPYIRLSTACDGSLPNEAAYTSLRVVCANTLRRSRLKDPSVFRQSHRSVFDATAAREVIEAANTAFGSFVQAARVLVKRRVDAQAADQFLLNLFQADGSIVDTKAKRESAAYKQVLALFNGAGRGARHATASGTEWGLLNAVTEYVDHHVRARSDDNRVSSSQNGPGALLKDRAFDLLTL